MSRARGCASSTKAGARTPAPPARGALDALPRSSSVNEILAAEAMQALDARVDLDDKTAEHVAGGYLSEPGMVQ
jgi:hypothetical protein